MSHLEVLSALLLTVFFKPSVFTLTKVFCCNVVSGILPSRVISVLVTCHCSLYAGY